MNHLLSALEYLAGFGEFYSINEFIRSFEVISKLLFSNSDVFIVTL